MSDTDRGSAPPLVSRRTEQLINRPEKAVSWMKPMKELWHPLPLVSLESHRHPSCHGNTIGTLGTDFFFFFLAQDAFRLYFSGFDCFLVRLMSCPLCACKWIYEVIFSWCRFRFTALNHCLFTASVGSEGPQFIANKMKTLFSWLMPLPETNRSTCL